MRIISIMLYFVDKGQFVNLLHEKYSTMPRNKFDI